MKRFTAAESVGQDRHIRRSRRLRRQAIQDRLYWPNRAPWFVCLAPGVTERHVPADLYERPEMGFGVPIDAWLRGPLKTWAADLLDPAAMTRSGFLDPAPIQEKWAEHQSGKHNWQHFLWNVLMFEAWRREQRAA